MKHQWKTNSMGQPAIFGDDYEYHECNLCGDIATCLDRFRHPELDEDECDGLDLTVEVRVSIIHPGKGTAWDDRSSVSQTYTVPLAQLIDGRVDLVELELRHQAAAMVSQWQIVKAAHHEDWERAVSAGQSAAVVLPGQHGTEEQR